MLGSGLAALGVLAFPGVASADQRRRIVVAADGSGDVTTIQAAVDAVPAGNSEPFAILVKPGLYHGRVVIPADRSHLVLVGLGRNPADVIITDDRANGTPNPAGGTWGTSGSASVTIDASDLVVRNLTLSNSFDEAAHPEITNRQAVAVLARGDRLSFSHVRFLANQDTLYLNSPNVTTFSRASLRHCYVEGDVDFIFGRGTAVLEHCHIHSLDRGSTTNNGYITAASTSLANPYGFLFTKCRFTAVAAPGTVYLGRPWHPSNDPDAVAQVVIRDSHLGEHLQAAPWTDFGVWPWRDARYFEYRNRGAGATVTPDRPQLSASDAALYTPETYLAGWDPSCWS
ncbi:pectinesterase [Rhizocola hellebori]|uniref:Pectinesterase n=1 Tax=Rhizocola hellebori TaxID=1392758 RepID=A0A8J3VE37_9ACTN|nr:pectinesterase [Rhizocola hellebori]